MTPGRNPRIYLLIMLVITAFGLPARLIQDQLPTWYTLYFGDYLWAMLLFFLFALTLRTSNTFKVAMVTLVFTYIIEISQLFHPQWLEYLRSIKLFALVLGYGFLWSDIAAYTVGVSTGALLECFLQKDSLRKVKRKGY
jgi:hypothetical protein